MELKHMEKLRDLLCKDLPITDRQISLGTREHQAIRIVFSSRSIHAQLIALGCTPKKSLTLTFPTNTQVPSGMHKHFIRGYFDGDGSVGVYSYKGKEPQIRCSFEGTQSMLQGIQQVFLQEIPGYTAVSVSKRVKQKSHVLQKGGNASVRSMYDYLYKDATVFLERKKDIFEAFFTTSNLAAQQSNLLMKIEEKIWKAEMLIRGEGAA
jgi:hypothetical protein